MIERRKLIGFVSVICIFAFSLVCLVLCNKSLPSTEETLLTDSIAVQSDTIVVDSLVQVMSSETKQKSKPRKRRHIKYQTLEGHLSPFDDYFMTYSKQIGLDWRLLAAISYCESHFVPSASSRKGAKGVMQLMPNTARHYGCPDSLFDDPEMSIKTAAELIEDIQLKLRNKLVRAITHEKIPYEKADTATRHKVDKDLLCFTIGAFHAGLGHINDAIVMADSLGYDPAKWYDNVEECLRLKADPKYYKLPYVRLGRFNGQITASYIGEVFDYFEGFKAVTKDETKPANKQKPKVGKQESKAKKSKTE